MNIHSYYAMMDLVCQDLTRFRGHLEGRNEVDLHSFLESTLICFGVHYLQHEGTPGEEPVFAGCANWLDKQTTCFYQPCWPTMRAGLRAQVDDRRNFSVVRAV